MGKRSVIITGVSSGIGKSLAHHFLALGDHVIGIGRHQPELKGDFVFLLCDLSLPDSVERLALPELEEEVILVNNAGRIGPIARLSSPGSTESSITFQLNTIAPMELTRMVYRSMHDKNKFTLINISSGAGKKPIPSWAVYCASKAAMDMWTACFYLEEQEKGIQLRVYCVAPGVVDTAMQQSIRASDPSEFSAHQRFVQLKEEGALFTPEEVTERLQNLLDLPYSGEIHFDLRNF